MATYNGARFLREQVDSILLQLNSEDELIVSDDGSTDDTIEILESYNDSRIKIFCNQEWHGVNGNFENALNNAKGEYIFLTDQDDVWISGKIEIVLKELMFHKAVVTNCYVVDSNLSMIYPSYFAIQHSRAGFLKNLYKSSYLGCCTAFRREMLSDILPIPRRLSLFHDWWIGFFIELSHDVIFIEEPYMFFRRHTDNTTQMLMKSPRSLYRKFYDRGQLLLLGFARKFKLI